MDCKKGDESPNLSFTFAPTEQEWTNCKGMLKEN